MSIDYVDISILPIIFKNQHKLTIVLIARHEGIFHEIYRIKRKRVTKYNNRIIIETRHEGTSTRIFFKRNPVLSGICIFHELTEVFVNKNNLKSSNLI